MLLLAPALCSLVCLHLARFGAGVGTGADHMHPDGHPNGHPNGPEPARQMGPVPVNLMEEQGYYLQQLFQQYGHEGTLSYAGLKTLLGSLGLGEVNVLEISHHGPRPSSDGLKDNGRPSTNGLKDSTGPSSVGLKDSGSPSSVGLKDSGSPSSDGLKDGGSHSNHAIQDHLHGNCLNVSQLLWNFGLGAASHITPDHFTFLCPALLYQIESRVCLRHEGREEGHADHTVSFLRALGWSFLALVVISLPSLLALGLVRLVPAARLRVLLCPMAALAVGTLCGDAMLHLLPHTRHVDHAELRDSVLKGLSVMGGLYFLFVMEGLLGLRNHYKKAEARRRRSEEVEWEATAMQDVPEEQQNHGHSHGHSHGPPGQDQEKGVGSLVWMVAMGDGIHNLTDGLAIGAAFSQSLTGGLSTTIAVLCHELPHELGDLAVLLEAGWPVRRLVFFSIASTLLGCIGLLAGSALGHHSAQITPWVLTVTAGVFLYVALANMMPEMLRGDPGPVSPLVRFLLQNLGLLAGGAIMLCIALFEDHIAFSLGGS